MSDQAGNVGEAGVNCREKRSDLDENFVFDVPRLHKPEIERPSFGASGCEIYVATKLNAPVFLPVNASCAELSRADVAKAADPAQILHLHLCPSG